MKRIKFLVIGLLFVAVSAMPAAAQFSFGPKVGVAINNLHFNKGVLNDVFSADNRAGFTGGLTAELMLPVFNLGFDASVMYVSRSASVKKIIGNDATVNTIKSDYIDIPINLKWKIGLPIIGKFLSPYLFTGPSFSFLVSKKATEEFFQNKTCDVSWNFGLGLQLFKKVQIGASYGLGITKAVTRSDDQVEGKNRYWTITAAYLF